jgi:hypothetical protein
MLVFFISIIQEIKPVQMRWMEKIGSEIVSAGI